MTTERLQSLEIVNMALGFSGNEPVQSGAPNTMVERQAFVFLPTIRDAILEEHPWNFASEPLASLTESTELPGAAATHVYELPDDFIRINEAESDLEQPWSLRGQMLTMSRRPTVLTYVFRLEDAARWPAMLKIVWAYNLAVAISGTSSTAEVRASLARRESAMEQMLIKAKRRDALQSVRPQRHRVAGSWITRRRNWSDGSAG